MTEQLDKPIAFGVNEQDKFEFGDMYHIAATLVFQPDLDICFVGTDPCHDKYFEFVQAFDPGNLKRISVEEYATDKDNYYRAGKSADVIQTFTIDGAIQQRLLDVSSVEEWDSDLRKFIECRISSFDKPTVLLWIRQQGYSFERNSTVESIKTLKNRLEHSGYQTVLAGSELNEFIADSSNFINFQNEEPFKSASRHVHCQLRMFRLLHDEYQVVASTGMMSGGMDGPAFFSNLAAYFFCKNEDSGRMAKVSETFTNMKIIHNSLTGPDTVFVDHEDTEIQQLLDCLSEDTIQDSTRNFT